MKTPLVSVVVATYRRNDSLKKALLSLSKQTMTDFEIVLVDDNSDAFWNTIVEEIVNSFAYQFPKISLNYIKNNTNLGSARSRNVAIAEAKGKFISFLDDDDLYLPDKLMHQLNEMISNNADYSITNLKLFYEDGSICEIRKRKYLLSNEKTNLLLCHLKYHMTGTDTMMFKKNFLESIGCFDPIDVGDEFYLMVKAIQANGSFIFCDFDDVIAIVHSIQDGLSSGTSKIKGENNLFKFKSSFFHKLRKSDIRYIKIRHHAVLAFVYKRSGNFYSFFIECLKALFIDPIQCLILIGSLK